MQRSESKRTIYTVYRTEQPCTVVALSGILWFSGPYSTSSLQNCMHGQRQVHPPPPPPTSNPCAHFAEHGIIFNFLRASRRSNSLAKFGRILRGNKNVKKNVSPDFGSIFFFGKKQQQKGRCRFTRSFRHVK